MRTTRSSPHRWRITTSMQRGRVVRFLVCLQGVRPSRLITKVRQGRFSTASCLFQPDFLWRVLFHDRAMQTLRCFQIGSSPFGRVSRNFFRIPGVLIGFEPLLSDGMIPCSWLCNGLETVVAERLHVLPNSNGLIDTFDDAVTIVSHIARDDVDAEPGLWLPWLIVEHDRSAEP